MKITVDKSELLSILTAHFGRPISDVVITKEPKKAGRIMEALREEINGMAAEHLANNEALQSFLRRPDKKILCIKALRAVTGEGLAESKWAIEHWTEWLACLRQKNRLPKVQGMYPNVIAV